MGTFTFPSRLSSSSRQARGRSRSLTGHTPLAGRVLTAFNCYHYLTIIVIFDYAEFSLHFRNVHTTLEMWHLVLKKNSMTEIIPSSKYRKDEMDVHEFIFGNVCFHHLFSFSLPESNLFQPLTFIQNNPFYSFFLITSPRLFFLNLPTMTKAEVSKHTSSHSNSWWNSIAWHLHRWPSVVRVLSLSCSVIQPLCQIHQL